MCLQQLSPVSPSEQAMVEALPMVRHVPVPRPPASHKSRVVAPNLPPSGDRNQSRLDLQIHTFIDILAA